MPFQGIIPASVGDLWRLTVCRGRGQFLVLAMIFAVAGCSGQTPFWQNSESGGASASSGAATPSVYYAGEDNLPLYGEPSTSKPPVGRLPLHKKVARDKIEKGYAHVKVDGTGQTGWVVNAKLIWKLPSSGKAATSTKAPAPPPKAGAQTPAPAAAPQAVDKPASDKPNTPTKKSADPSVFDAF